MRPVSVVVILVTLITSALAGEQKAATMRIDAAPMEEVPLPHPKPSLHDVTGDNPAVLISAFRHQNGEGSVVISPALTRIAQEQANAMAVRDLLDHNALAPFSSRIGRSGFSRAGENIAYGHVDFASTLKQWINSAGHRANLLLHGAKWIGVAEHKMPPILLGNGHRDQIEGNGGSGSNVSDGLDAPIFGTASRMETGLTAHLAVRPACTNSGKRFDIKTAPVIGAGAGGQGGCRRAVSAKIDDFSNGRRQRSPDLSRHGSLIFLRRKLIP